MFLVGGFNPSEKYEFVKWDDEVPNWMEKIRYVSNHQPAHIYIDHYRSRHWKRHAMSAIWTPLGLFWIERTPWSISLIASKTEFLFFWNGYSPISICTSQSPQNSAFTLTTWHIYCLPVAVVQRRLDLLQISFTMECAAAASSPCQCPHGDVFVDIL